MDRTESGIYPGPYSEGETDVKRLERYALICELIDAMHEAGSWCGETHVQKSVYFLQELFEVPVGYRFILYKHGPFSFDLRDELAAMSADDFVRLEARIPEYGPSYVVSRRAELLDEYSQSARQFAKQVDWVARRISHHTVAELERLATALYVLREAPEGADTGALARRIHELKPHVPVERAEMALREVQTMRSEARELGLLRT